MPSSPALVRSSVYRVTNQARQQRILRAIERVADPSITAQAMTHNDEFLIAAKSTSATADVHVRRIVMSLDLSAKRLTSTGELYDKNPPSSAYIGSVGFTRTTLRSLRRIV